MTLAAAVGVIASLNLWFIVICNIKLINLAGCNGISVVIVVCVYIYDHHISF